MDWIYKESNWQRNFEREWCTKGQAQPLNQMKQHHGIIWIFLGGHEKDECRLTIGASS